MPDLIGTLSVREDFSHPLSFDGKTALVTGGGRRGEVAGIGYASSRVLAGLGARVAVLDLWEERARSTCDHIAAAGGVAFPVVADVSDIGQCEAAVEKVVAEFDGIDVLVNNAAIVRGGDLESVRSDDWDQVLAVNLSGPMRMSRAVVPSMRARGGGVIINISSVGGLMASGDVAYGAAKTGLLGLTRDLAYTLGPEGIRANAIAPGHVYAAMVEGGDDAVREARRRAAPMGIEGDAWDIAWAVAFLASGEARFINGAVLPVDAGATSTMPLSMLPLMLDGAPKVSDFLQSER